MRGSLAVVAALVLVTGCGARVDTAKATYPRTTVPAGDLPGPAEPTGGGAPAANDPALTPERLRLVDPCPLVDEDALAGFGTPADTVRGDFNECSNFMEDGDGKELNLTVTVGERVTNALDADENIAGLPALEDPLDSGEACFVWVVTSASPNMGISIQANGEAEDLCAPARTLMTEVVGRLRDDPPAHDTPKGTLVEVDPCTLFEDGELDESLGAPVERSPASVHWCTWNGAGASAGTWLRVGFDPSIGADDSTPVDLGDGITGYEEKTEDPDVGVSCTLHWKHRPFAGDDVEVASVFYDTTGPRTGGGDACAPARTIAKAVALGLPKP